MLAGDERYRAMEIALKSIFDSMILMSYIPRQVLDQEKPYLIVRTNDQISPLLSYLEVEVSAKYWLELRRNKVEAP